MYLPDTVVLSELRRWRPDPGLVSWLEHARPTDAYLSVVTIGEVEKGIAKQQRQDLAFAERLAGWLDGVLRYYATRILASIRTLRVAGDGSPTHTAMPVQIC